MIKSKIKFHIICIGLILLDAIVASISVGIILYCLYSGMIPVKVEEGDNILEILNIYIKEPQFWYWMLVIVLVVKSIENYLEFSFFKLRRYISLKNSRKQNKYKLQPTPHFLLNLLSYFLFICTGYYLAMLITNAPLIISDIGIWKRLILVNIIFWISIISVRIGVCNLTFFIEYIIYKTKNSHK